jgi:hypothetical protein
VRIFGPDKSTKTASGLLSFAAAALARLIVSMCCSGVPCDIFIRTAFSPTFKSDSMISWVSEAGPRVAKIFALLIDYYSATKLRENTRFAKEKLTVNQHEEA